MICVSIGRGRHASVIEQHRELAGRGVELVEYRLDFLRRPPDVTRLLKDRPTPCIVTCRRREEKGLWTAGEEKRLAVLREAIVAGADYVDLELDIAKSIPRYGKTKRIVSYHNFDETPDDLAAIHKRLADCDPDLVKIVTTANWPGDNARVLELVRAAKVPTVGFCMGEIGTVSRVLAGQFGSPFTFATVSRERETAPGQIPFDELRDRYRYEAIRPETRVYAVAGDPIAHSHSPLIHNAALQSAGIDAVYLPLRIQKGMFAGSVKQLNPLGIAGYSVTIPHKEVALEMAAERDPQAVKIGAANTLFRTAEGSWAAENTDFDAAMSVLREALRRRNPEATLNGKRTLIMGAGGVARALALGCVQEGAVVSIASRTRARAEALAAAVGATPVSWQRRSAGFLDVVVNCTPIGMHPNVDETPLPENILQEHMTVFDTVYTPENTLLLKQARERGAETASGLEMFIRQAAAQFERFTGRPAPVEVMRDALRRGISPVKLR